MRLSVLTLAIRLATTLVLAVVLAATAYTPRGYAQADPLNGTWMLNVGRSIFPLGGPGPKSQTVTFEGTGATKNVISEAIDAQGKKATFTVTHIYDGQPHSAAG
jgi:hypothetical protein